MHEKLKRRERRWETHLESVDTFLDDEYLFIIDQMINAYKILMKMFFLVTLVPSLHATRRENQ